VCKVTPVILHGVVSPDFTLTRRPSNTAPPALRLLFGHVAAQVYESGGRAADCVKSPRPSYTGLYPQNEVLQVMSLRPLQAMEVLDPES